MKPIGIDILAPNDPTSLLHGPTLWRGAVGFRIVRPLTRIERIKAWWYGWGYTPPITADGEPK